jgi:hypothetical protein
MVEASPQGYIAAMSTWSESVSATKRAVTRVLPEVAVAKLRRLCASQPSSARSATTSQPQPLPTATKPRRAHPLPTLNLAAETRLSDAEAKAEEANNRFLQFNAGVAVIDRVVGRLSDRVNEVMAGAGLDDRSYSADIEEFLVTFESNPAAGMGRTTATGSLLWLHLLTKALQPQVIVESGVYRGASLHTLFHAGAGARVHAYDIDLSNLVFSDPAITFHEGDWTEQLPVAETLNDICYFDDHINNCLRIRQAYEQGFRHIVFDDSPDIGQLHSWRYPGVPTIQMVVNQTIEPGEWVEWIWRKQKLRYTFREEDAHGVAELVDKMIELPSLTMLTGRRTGVQTYVRLKQ